MFEIELKFPLRNPSDFRQQVIDRGGVSHGVRENHSDTYYAHPCRNFAETTEALRIRDLNGHFQITYKGPKLPGEVKTRQELEWPLGDGDPRGENMSTMLLALGFQPVASVRKVRETLVVSQSGDDRSVSAGLRVTLDEVAEIGWYTEIEALAAKESEIPAAREAVVRLARELGLTEHEPLSYLKLLLNWRKSSPED